jgi:hypothetical protein
MSQATPLQIARYGHIAAALREYLRQSNTQGAALNEAIGAKRDSPRSITG